jgi:hypothetical protein
MITKRLLQPETGMKKWIDQIRSKPDHYGTRYWKYHLSGSVMELLIEKPYSHSQPGFRMAVIHIGMVLQALCELAEQQQQSIMIQSFPSLEDLHIAAAVRIQKGQAKVPQSSESLKKDRAELTPSGICTIAENFQLCFEEISPDRIPGELVEKREPQSRWYVLTSSFDNPFTWLRTGQWKEAVYRAQPDSKEGKPPLIISDRQFENSDLKKHPEFKEKYIQSIVAL